MLLSLRLDAVPAHVGQTQIGIRIKGKTNALCLDPTQSGSDSFFAPLTKELHSQANPQDGLTLFEDLMMEPIDQSARLKILHRAVESPHPRQDQFFRRREVSRVAGDHAGVANLPQHVFDRAEIAHPVVDDRDHCRDGTRGLRYTSTMNATLQNWLTGQIETLKAENLYKVPKILETPAGGRVRMNGKEVVNLSSNNYLGLANHPKVREAALRAIDQWGVGAGAVRWIGGTMSVHEELENRLAKFKHTEAVLVFTGGFTANSGCIPAVLSNEDVVISDELNHASIIDGVRLSSAKYKKSEGYVYAHKDMEQLESILRATQSFAKRMIITDGVFSMDGDIAPLPDIAALAEQYDAFVMVDDAHASGVLGKNGAGTASHFNLYGRVDIQLGTLSKALGVIGGYIAGSAALKDWLINRGRPYLFSTAHPPMVAAALIAALDVMENDPTPMERLWANTRWWKENLAAQGFDTMGSETPITPVYVGDEAAAQQMERLLWEEGVYALSIVYPTVGRGKARLRTMPSAAHTQEDLEFALQAFVRVREKLGTSALA